MSMFFAKFGKFLVCFLGITFLVACNEKNTKEWKLGKDQPMSKVLVDVDSPKRIKICSDKYKHISFPLVLHVDYDDKRYYGLLEGVCITVNAKKLRVKFANPSSGKAARGTFEILDS